MDLKFDPQNPKYEYITSQDSAKKALEKLAKEKIVGVDVEATGVDPFESKLLLLQIATPDFGYVFDANKVDLKLLKDFLEGADVLKIMQNGKFDYAFLKYQRGIAINNIYDTMLSESLLQAGLKVKPESLESLAWKYLEIDMSEMKRNIRVSFIDHRGPITLEQRKYAALDALILIPIFERQWPKLKKEDLIKIAKLEFAVTRVVAEMELSGMHVNQEKWREIISRLKKKRDMIAKEFQEAIRPLYRENQVGLFGGMADSINLNSQPQLMDLFNNRLRIEVPSTGDFVLAGVNHPVAKVLRDYRGYEKLISAFGDSLLEKINPKTGRFHPDFMQLGTATGRFACANPNLQQIPRQSEEAPFRACFNPGLGNKLVVTDYSQMEMRILADLSGDEKLIKALTEDLDIHSFTASLMFNKEYSKDFRKKYPELRQIGKNIGFGLMYGMGAMGLSRQTDVAIEEAEDYINRYFKNFPSVKRFMDSMAKNALKRGWSSTPGGRKRWYHLPDKNDVDYRRKLGRIEREAKNHPIQGTNADATKYALVFLHEKFKKEKVDGFITHTIHDEIVTEVREDQAQDWAPIQAGEMERAGELFIKKVPVISIPFVGDVWEH